MDVISIPDFASVDPNPPLVEEGWHTVTIDQEPEERVSQKNNKYLNWTFTITDGPNVGAKLFYTTMLEGKGLSFLKRLCEACGAGDVGDGVDINAMIGTSLQAQVGHKPMKDSAGNVTDEMRAEVVKIKAL